MSEKNIKYENGIFWVKDNKIDYTVYKADVTHSIADSSYPHDADGLSLAIARCNYLFKKRKCDLFNHHYALFS